METQQTRYKRHDIFVGRDDMGCFARIKRGSRTRLLLRGTTLKQVQDLALDAVLAHSNGMSWRQLEERLGAL